MRLSSEILRVPCSSVREIIRNDETHGFVTLYRFKKENNWLAA